MENRRLLTLAALAVVALALCAGCSLQKDDAKTRVENVLNGLGKDDMSTEYQLAVCQWFDGTYAMNQADLEPTLDKFDRWLKQKSLKAPVGSCSVGKVTVVGSTNDLKPASLILVSRI